MSLQWKDESFEMRTGLWAPPSICLAVQPHVVDFPARCVNSFGHEGLHRSGAGYVGGHPTAITYWSDDE